MKVFNVSIMLTVQLTYILLFLSLCASVLTFPSIPLNEKGEEISWQAWLLVDDQNQQIQNRQGGGDDGDIYRRRLFPKSVFVAPSFSPENLPACADGYSSDDMGRCIKIIKIDEDRHLEFLVSKLNDKFGVIDYEEEVEEIDATKSEPFQLNIPLNLDDTDYSSDTPQEDLDFAIIVTPTTRDSDQSKNVGVKVDKRNGQSNEDKYEEELKKLLKMTTTKKYDDTTRFEDFEKSTDVSEGVASYTTTDKNEIETTTVQTVEDTETTTLYALEEGQTTTVVTTTSDAVEESTTIKELNEGSLIEPFEEVEATTFTETTTTLEGTTEEPTTFEHSKLSELTSTTPKITTVTPKITTYHPKAITYHPYLDLSILDNSKTKNLIKFPDVDDVPAIPRNHPDGGFVRFPDVDLKYQQESQIHHTRDVNDQSGNYFNEIVTPESSHRVQEVVLPPKGVLSGFFPSEARQMGPGSSEPFHPKFFPSQGASENTKEFHLPLVNQHKYQYNMVATTERHPSKRSREKHGNMFVLPPKWSQGNHQKPLVLRFSRKHFNVDTNKFKNNQFYRSLPMDDLSFLFGYKQGQTSHR